MKKLYLLLALALLPRMAHSQSAAQVGGVVTDGGISSPGAAQAVTFDNQKALLNSEYNARYYQLARQGLLNTINAGQITVGTNDTSKNPISATGSGFRFLVGFYNPLGNTKAAVIIKAVASYISGTPTPLAYNMLCGYNWTSAATGNIKSGLLGAANANSSMIPQVQVALAATPVTTATPIEYSPMGGPSVLATGGMLSLIDPVDGAIIVQPGCAFGIVAQLIGTSHVLIPSISFYEVKFP